MSLQRRENLNIPNSEGEKGEPAAESDDGLERNFFFFLETLVWKLQKALTAKDNTGSTQ